MINFAILAYCNGVQYEQVERSVVEGVYCFQTYGRNIIIIY